MAVSRSLRSSSGMAIGISSWAAAVVLLRLRNQGHDLQLPY
jgi:hypothetical protein